MSSTTPTRAALYARYSTDQQRQTSIVDQLRDARDRAAREGWAVVATHADEGISGSVPVAMRRGGKALLADALAGRWEVLIVEGLDRLSREIGEAEQLVKRLEHRGIRIIGTADGYDSDGRGRKVMRIARGLVNELYLDDLREKTHRGLAGQVDRGFSAGGRTYGYRTKPEDGGRRMVIDENEAAIVREVFRRFAEGQSTRAIVHELNRRAVPSARGGTWAVSALQGSSTKGLGMLNNELYIGRVVWNRRQWLKDPDTGARRYVERPREEWQQREDPALRIVDEALWQAVRDRARTGPARGTRTGAGAVPRTLFTGILRCHGCGAAVVAINRERYGCSARKDRGPTVCANARTIRREVLDKRLLAEVREELLAPEALRDLRREVQAELASAVAGLDTGRDAACRRLDALQGEIGRLVDAVAQVGLSAALAARLQAAEAEQHQLQRQLAATPATALPTVDEVLAPYRQQVMQLQRVLESEGDRDQVRTLLSQLIGPVVVGHDEAGAWAEMEKPAERLLLQAAGGGSLEVVAGARSSYRRRIRL